MLTPEYLQNVPDRMVNLYAQAEADILADMARRISTYDYWIPAAEHQAKMLEEAGMTREEILKRLKKLTGKSQKELKELMQEAGTVALKSDDEVYRRAGLDPAPIGASKDLQNVLQAGYDKTSATFQNLTMTTARTATQQFERALDRAYMQITMGGFDYNTAVRSAIKQLSADGVGAIRYPSGKIDTIEVAVRRATITGVNQTALRLQDTRADELGCDLVEVSAHSGARPEHAIWQGEIYSRSGKSKKYPDFVKSTLYGQGEGLGGWNCSHSFRPWFEGMSRTYSEGLLEEYEARNFEYNGKKLTEYEALQEQRRLERQIRRWKREQNALQAAGLDTSEATAKVREWNGKHKDFLEQTGLKADGTRVAIGNNLGQRVNPGYHNLAEMARVPDISKGNMIKSADSVYETGKLDPSVLSQSKGSPEMVSKLVLYNDATEWITKTTVDHAFYYDEIEDVIVRNPNHPHYDKYDLNYVKIHELTHRIDVLEIETWKNELFENAIETCKKRVYDKKEEVLSMVDYGGIYEYDAAFNDIISGLTDGEFNAYLTYGHPPSVWKDQRTKSMEIFANIACIDVLEYGSKNEFEGILKEIYVAYKEMIK